MKAVLSTMCVAAVILLSCAPTADAQRRRARQTEFGAETPIKRKVKVPGYVIQQMVDAIRGEGLTVTSDIVADIASGARGSLVNLNGDGRDDLLVQGDPGANVTSFWLFRNNGRRFELVLYTIALNLTIHKTRTRGYHNVEIVAASAVTGWNAVYEFDGKRYKPVGCWEHDLGVGKDGGWGPGRRIECSNDVKPYR